MTDDRPAFQPTQEVRFATVLYGGVSLAIYINGVVQELLHLVRATAPDRPTGDNPDRVWKSEEELSGSERVYRRLGQMLTWGEPPRQERPGSSDPITTRFVVDILSGSSAGGINGIFLAKALANEQEMDQLKRLWIDEGDIAKLIDDKKSYKGLTLQRSRPPRSVLNSRRMYWKLLEAFDGMEDGPGADTSRLVDELDLWVTATDIHGLLLPIDLYDRVVYEKRHRNVLHLRYGSEYARGDTPVNDFLEASNPFLAFAARCTSAFPFAFEPMALEDVDEVLRTDAFSHYRQGSTSPAWHKFFDDYVRARRAAGEPAGDEHRYYAAEAFGDGGYLDNKPFSWATQNLDSRRADLPVDRRLIYVEPDPGERQPAWTAPEDRPDALENVQAAVLTLPRTEPIRDDLEQLIKRNRDIARISDIAQLVDRTANEFPDMVLKPPPLEEWRTMSLSRLLEQYGGGLQYVAYHRLKIAGALDDLALLVTKANGLSPDSDECSAVRCLLQAWSEEHYPEEPDPELEYQSSQNEFLLRFDLGFRQRRLNFVSERIEQLLRYDKDAKKLIRRFVPELSDVGLDEYRAQAREVLRGFKARMNGLMVELQAATRKFGAPDTGNPLTMPADGPRLGSSDLLGLLHGATSKEESVERARRLIQNRGLDGPISAAFDALERQLKPVFTENRDGADRLLEAPGLVPGPVSEISVKPLRHFYLNYESYDAIILPLSYGSVGETSPVEVIRISPQDAPSLIDEKSGSDGRRKLAGVSFAHFGGFFERAWRRNDLMWGRLDAAERIIDTTLLPDTVPDALRDELLKEAQLAIIKEELYTDGREPLTALMTRSLLGTTVGAEDEKSFARLLADERPDDLQTALESTLDPEAIWSYLDTEYEVSHEVDRERLLGTMGRATQVTGQVLDGVSDRYEILKKPSRWLVRVGQVMWGLVQVATPRTMPQLLFRYWLPLFVLIAVLLILGGAIFGSPATSKAGWVLVGVVLGWRLAVWLTQDLIRRRAGWAIGTAVVLAGLVAGLALAEISLHLGSDAAKVLNDLPGPVEDVVRWLWPWGIPNSG